MTTLKINESRSGKFYHTAYTRQLGNVHSKTCSTSPEKLLLVLIQGEQLHLNCL